MRCHRLSVGELPHSARVFAFPELVASMRAVCACLHMEVQNLTLARCYASGPGVFCLQWAEMELGLLDGPPHGQGGQHYVLRSRSFVPIFGCLSVCVWSGVLLLCFSHCDLNYYVHMVILAV